MPAPRRRSRFQPRKRPRQGRSTATVEAIVEAAARILERSGPDALTTNAVAERAGVSVGSLYPYFPAKEAILADLIRRERAAFERRLADAIAAVAGRDLPEALIALIDVAVAQQLDNPRLARALDYLESTTPLEAAAADINQRIGGMVIGFLRTHAAAHACRDHAQAAADLIALAKGMIDAAGQAGETDARSLRARVRRAALGYLGAG
jgi:AcrR family transcriptional regulator